MSQQCSQSGARTFSLFFGFLVDDVFCFQAFQAKSNHFNRNIHLSNILEHILFFEFFGVFGSFRAFQCSEVFGQFRVFGLSRIPESARTRPKVQNPEKSREIRKIVKSQKRLRK